MNCPVGDVSICSADLLFVITLFSSSALREVSSAAAWVPSGGTIRGTGRGLVQNMSLKTHTHLHTHPLPGKVNKLFVLSVSRSHSVRVPSLRPSYETPFPLRLGLRLSEAVPDRAPQLPRKPSGVKVPAIVTLCFSLERLLSFAASGSARGETKICW